MLKVNMHIKHIVFTIFFIIIIHIQCRSTYNVKEISLEITTIYKQIESTKVNEQKVCKCITLTTKENEKLAKKLRIIKNVNQNVLVLHKNIIVNMLHVEKIILSNKKITTIKSSAFNNLPSLKHVDLSQNKIATLEFGIFVKVPKLRHLNLENNKLWHFEQQWFGKIDTLEWLTVEYNLIKTITSKAFVNFPNLKYFNLAHNKVQLIDEDAFLGVNELEMLDLSYNRIHYLADDVFGFFNSLQILNLYGNELSYISENVLNSLKDLYEMVILFNPWQCGCYSKIIEWASNEYVGVDNQYLKCNSTDNLENIPVCVLTNSSYTTCFPYEQDFCNIIYLEQKDFKCYFEYDKYLKFEII